MIMQSEPYFESDLWKDAIKKPFSWLWRCTFPLLLIVAKNVQSKSSVISVNLLRQQVNCRNSLSLHQPTSNRSYRKEHSRNLSVNLFPLISMETGSANVMKLFSVMSSVSRNVSVVLGWNQMSGLIQCQTVVAASVTKGTNLIINVFVFPFSTKS